MNSTEFLFILVFLTISILFCWKIISKTGFPGVLSLLLFIPLLNLVMVIILAFIEWPIEKELKALKEKYNVKTDEI